MADDHADHVEALRLAGYHVETAPNALEALRRGHALRPDALIVPLALPGDDVKITFEWLTARRAKSADASQK